MSAIIFRVLPSFPLKKNAGLPHSVWQEPVMIVFEGLKIISFPNLHAILFSMIHEGNVSFW